MASEKLCRTPKTDGLAQKWLSAQCYEDVCRYRYYMRGIDVSDILFLPAELQLLGSSFSLVKNVSVHLLTLDRFAAKFRNSMILKLRF